MTGYGKYGSPGVCRCCGCTIYGDEFTTDTLASNWDQVAGTWAIAGGVLSIDESDALLIANQVHPDGNYVSQVLSVDVRLAAADDLARLIILYDDSDNYLFAEFWIDANGCGRMEAFERIAGVDTSLGEFAVSFAMPLDTSHTITLCYAAGESVEDPGSLTLKAESSDGKIWKETVATTADLPGDQAGVGSGATAADTIEFDNFDYQYYYDAETHPECPQCEGNEACEQHADDFNRAELGCTWDQVAGSWSIDTNQLTIDEEGGILIDRTPLPDDSVFVQVAFKFRSQADVVILVILDYTDEDNFLYVKLEPGSHGECGRVSFWRKTAGVDTQLGIDSLLLGMSADTGETHTVVVCWRDGFIKVTLTPDAATDYTVSSHSVASVAQVSANPFVGLGTGAGGGTNSVWFDDFTLKRVQQEGVEATAACEECEPQNCVLYFNNPREDATSFPTTFNCLWTIIVGGWTINSLTSSNAATLFLLATSGGTAYNELIEIDDSDAMLINETGHPLTTAEGFLDLTSAAEVEVISFNYGEIVRLLIGVQDDENYLYAEWEWAADDESTGFLRLGKVEAGVDTELVEEASSIVAGQPQGDHNGASPNFQLPSILRVCYDGFELKAHFTNGADVAYFSGKETFANADAGIGWNPGKSGLATGAITGSIFFGGFRFVHDIFSGVGFECVPCQSSAVCGLCEQEIDEEIIDTTPPIVLLEIQNLAPDMASACPDANQFGDTFALSFYEYQTTGVERCIWRIRPHFCEDPDPAHGKFSQIAFGFERLSGSPWRIRPYAQIQGYVFQSGPSPGYVSKGASWYYDHDPAVGLDPIPGTDLPGWQDTGGGTGQFNCTEWLADWLNLSVVYPGFSFGLPETPNWLVPGGTGDPSTARAKVLA